MRYLHTLDTDAIRRMEKERQRQEEERVRKMELMHEKEHTNKSLYKHVSL